MSFLSLSKLPPQKCLQVISPETRVMTPEIQYFYVQQHPNVSVTHLSLVSSHDGLKNEMYFTHF